ncbi:Os02g0131050, partial [Oryza sativa Japonica Group]
MSCIIPSLSLRRKREINGDSHAKMMSWMLGNTYHQPLSEMSQHRTQPISLAGNIVQRLMFCFLALFSFAPWNIYSRHPVVP